MLQVCPVCDNDQFDRDGNCIYCSQHRWLKPGTVLDGRYEILKAVKAGGMGAVYRGHDTRLKQICAIKEMLSDDTENLEYMKKRFEAEAKLLADLRHNGIPRVTDYFIHKNRYYLVMDYLDGVDLFSYIAEKNYGKPLDEKTVVKWAIEVCDILIYLHGQKPQPILHRDLKPSNIFLDKDGRIMLIDFGLARPVNVQSATEKTIVGTMGYAPLEQYQGHPEPRSDLYSLGGVMHFLLTAVQPAVFKFEPLKSIRPDISDWIDVVIKKVLSLRAENRFSSAVEMKEVLERKRETGQYKDDSGELEKIQSELIIEEQPAYTRKGFLSQKKSPLSDKGQKAKGFSAILGGTTKNINVDRIIDMGEKGNSDGLEPLIELLKSEEYKDKHRKIVELLGNYKDDAAVDALIKSLSHTDEMVRRYAPMSLAKIGARNSVKELVKLINDPKEPVRKSALKAIGEFTDKQTMGLITNFIGKDIKEYKNKFPKNKELFFDSLEELILHVVNKEEPLKVSVHLAILYEIEGIYSEAEEQITKALEIKEDDIAIQIIYGKILGGLKKYSEAIDVYNDVYIELQNEKIEEELRRLYYNYGRSLEKENRLKDGIDNYEKAIFLNPGYKENDFFEALVLFKKKTKNKSMKILNMYFDRNPSGLWREEALELQNEIREAPFMGITNWLKDIF